MGDLFVVMRSAFCAAALLLMAGAFLCFYGFLNIYLVQCFLGVCIFLILFSLTYKFRYVFISLVFASLFAWEEGVIQDVSSHFSSPPPKAIFKDMGRIMLVQHEVGLSEFEFNEIKKWLEAHRDEYDDVVYQEVHYFGGWGLDLIDGGFGFIREEREDRRSLITPRAMRY